MPQLSKLEHTTPAASNLTRPCASPPQLNTTELAKPAVPMPNCPHRDSTNHNCRYNPVLTPHYPAISAPLISCFHMELPILAAFFNAPLSDAVELAAKIDHIDNIRQAKFTVCVVADR